VHTFLLRIRSQEKIHACGGAQHRTVVTNPAHEMHRCCPMQTLLQAGNQSKFAKFAN
jgi:hypothetical protein